MAGGACVDLNNTTLHNCDTKNIILSIKKDKKKIIENIKDIFPNNKITIKTAKDKVHIKIGNDLTLITESTYRISRNYLRVLLRRLKGVYELNKRECNKVYKGKKCYVINTTIKHLSKIKERRNLPREFNEKVYLHTKKELIGGIIFNSRNSSIERLFIDNAEYGFFCLGSGKSIITDKYTDPRYMERVMIYDTTKSVTVVGLNIFVESNDGFIEVYTVNKGNNFPKIVKFKQIKKGK